MLETIKRIPPAFSLLIWLGLWEIAGRLELAFEAGELHFLPLKY